MNQRATTQARENQRTAVVGRRPYSRRLHSLAAIPKLPVAAPRTRDFHDVVEKSLDHVFEPDHV